MGFGKSFGNKAGKNTANALFNMFGIDFSDRKRISIDRAESQRIKEASKASIAWQKELNSIDSAVLNNVDKVAGVRFSKDSALLCNELDELVIHLESNQWGSVTDDEARIRNKYTDAVLSKIKRGVRQLELIDPLNLAIDDYKASIRKAMRRKYFGKYWIIIVFILMCSPLVLFAAAENNNWFWHDFFTVVLVIILIYVTLKIALALFRLYRRKNREKAYYLKNQSPEQSYMAQNIQHQPITQNKTTEAINPIKHNTTYVLKGISINELREKYDALWNKYHAINEIMERGYSASITTSQKDILIIGFNPSIGKIEGSFLYPLPDEKTGYWKDVNSMLKSRKLNLRSNSTYIDLFAFKETDQNSAIKNVIQNPLLFSYVIDQVTLTQEIIENVIRPKVIVVKNKAAWAFMGKEKEFTWMGYNFERIANTPHGELCRIKGFREEKDRINASIIKSNIEGAWTLFTTHTAVAAYPTPEFLQDLIDKGY